MINFLSGVITGGAIVLIILCAFAVNHDKSKPATTAATATGTDFWRELLPNLYEACGADVYPCLSDKDHCMGTLNGDTLTVQIKGGYYYKTISYVGTFEALEEAASKKAGRPIKVILLYDEEGRNV